MYTATLYAGDGSIIRIYRNVYSYAQDGPAIILMKDPTSVQNPLGNTMADLTLAVLMGTVIIEKI